MKAEIKSGVEGLETSLSALGIELSGGRLELLERYCRELVRWNRRLNLTGARTVEELAAGPLFDALTLVPVLERSGRLLDIGSGGGLPGVPAAIACPELTLTLVEPRARRAAFLRHAVHLLRLDCEVVQTRAEELAWGEYDGAVAQAVWPAGEWIPRGAALVGEGKALYALTAEPLDEPKLQGRAEVEAHVDSLRPRDDRKRHAYRLRMHVASQDRPDW
ncbi:MAG: 16S rRNA (guanine(527)-N(7))-methyltransferase RsmG [Polyangia bacterium]